MTKQTQPPKRTFIRVAIWVALGSLALTVVLAMIPESGIFGRLMNLGRQGLGSFRAIPALVISGVILCCFGVFLQGMVEDIGWLKTKEEWHDWRDEPLPPPEHANPQTQKNKRSTNKRLFEKERWTHRGSIRRRRGTTARKHWGYNNDYRVK